MTNKVTVLVGAGATIDIGGHSTDDLTKIIKDIKFEYYNLETKQSQPSNLLTEIYDILSKHYNNKSVNFEDIMHTLELLESYAGKSGKPAIIPFIKEMQRGFSNRMELKKAIEIIIKTIAAKINEYSINFMQTSNDWYRNFWDTKELTWNITTLNYDDTIEQSLKNNYEDGFDCTPETFATPKCYRFNPLYMKKDTKHILAHIHGCINFGYPSIDSAHMNDDKYIYEDSFGDLYKFDSYSDAKKTWFNRSEHTDQSQENIVQGPIITGLRKSEKINTYPYISYLNNFYNTLINNDKLLIIGYGFGDLYINRIIEKINFFHKDSKNIAIISYHPDYNTLLESNFLASEEHYFYCKIFKIHSFSSYIQYQPKGYILKNNNDTVRIYLNGFKDAIENHANDIINFLK